MIDHLSTFLAGEAAGALRSLEEEMRIAAESLRFEARQTSGTGCGF